MKILKTFFAYDLLFPFGVQSITPIFISIIILFFLFFLFVLIHRTKSIKSNVDKLNKNLSENTFKNDEIFNLIWQDYKSTFIDFGNSKKTTESSHDYFNENNVISSITNLNILNSIPSILVGLGILGTFIGLTFGISNFHTESAEAIKESVSILLAGMGTAFLTSIWGMLLSIIYTLLSKWRLSSLDTSLNKLSNKLDKNFKISRGDELEHLVNKQKDLFHEYFAFKNAHNFDVKPAFLLNDILQETKNSSQSIMKNTKLMYELFTYKDEDFKDVKPSFLLRSILEESRNHSEKLEKNSKQISELFIYEDESKNQVKPANVLRDLYQEAKQQSVALSSFSTDLANIIEAGFERILNNPEQGVTHELSNLKQEIINLGNQIEAPATDMLEGVINDLKESLNSMLKQFNTSIKESTEDDLENLTKSLQTSADSLNEFPMHIENMAKNLLGSFSELKETVSQVSENTLNQSTESADRMSNSVNMLTNQVTENIQGLQSSQTELINQQNSNLNNVTSLLESFNNSVLEVKLLNQEVTNSLGAFESVTSQLNSTSTNLQTVSSNVVDSTMSIKNTQEAFNNQANNFLVKNQDVIDEMKNALTQAKNLSTDYVTQFEVIDKGLKGIFEKIDQGLVGYRDTVGQSMSSYLQTYSEALTNTAQSLAGAAEKQTDILFVLENLLEDIGDNN